MQVVGKMLIFMFGLRKAFLWRQTMIRGFTLIEILVATSIATLIFTVGGTRYIDFNNTQVIKSAGLTLKNNLRDTQTKALAGVKPTVADCTAPNLLNHYRVTFTSSTTYTSEAFCLEPDNDQVASGVRVTYTLPENVIFNSSFSSIRFQVLGRVALSPVNNINIRNDAPISLNTKWYSLCVSRSGDIRDCGYTVSGSSPTCNC